MSDLVVGNITHAVSRVAELEAELAALKAERELRPIESAPEWVEILVWSEDRGSIVVIIEAGEFWADNSVITHELGYKPTHWQPLPAPPVQP